MPITDEDSRERGAPFVEWFPDDGISADVAERLPRGHPGVVVGRGPKHVDVSWIAHEDEPVSAGAVYDTTMIREIDVYTFAERVLGLRTGRGTGEE